MKKKFFPAPIKLKNTQIKEFIFVAIGAFAR